MFDLRHAQVLVLDEADRMFDLGFIADIRYLLRRLPPPDQRQSMLFSATLSQRVLELAYEHMNNPELVRIEPDKITADRVRQIDLLPGDAGEDPAADRPAAHATTPSARWCSSTPSAWPSGSRTCCAPTASTPRRCRATCRRTSACASCRTSTSGELAVLIATDVASRGLHMPDVSHVFNYDLPQDAADYVHRIGRTARAGAEGDAISFACEDYAISLPDIENYIGHKIPNEPITPDLMAQDMRWPPRRVWEPRPGPGGSRGGRGGGGSGGFGGRSGGGGGRPPPRRSGGGFSGRPGGGGGLATTARRRRSAGDQAAAQGQGGGLRPAPGPAPAGLAWAAARRGGRRGGEGTAASRRRVRRRSAGGARRPWPGRRGAAAEGGGAAPSAPSDRAADRASATAPLAIQSRSTTPSTDSNSSWRCAVDEESGRRTP